MGRLDEWEIDGFTEGSRGREGGVVLSTYGPAFWVGGVSTSFSFFLFSLFLIFVWFRPCRTPCQVALASGIKFSLCLPKLYALLLRTCATDRILSMCIWKKASVSKINA